MAGALMVTPFCGMLWNQFFVSSQAARSSGVAENLPFWFAPQDPLNEAGQRTFFKLEVAARRSAWSSSARWSGGSTTSSWATGCSAWPATWRSCRSPWPPSGRRASWPWPSSRPRKAADRPTRWRWRVFAIGGVLGLAFGAVYLGLPTITTALFKTPIILFPIPFSDWTTKTQDFLPAVATGLSYDAGQFMFGMVLPFFAMVGSFIGLLITMIANPFLYKAGILHTWQRGDGTMVTLFKNNIDFYFSFGMGLAIAIAGVGVLQAVRGLLRSRRQHGGRAGGHGHAPAQARRGDIRVVVRAADVHRHDLGVHRGQRLPDQLARAAATGTTPCCWW